VAFAFFKLLDLPGFASTFAGYDVIARRWPAYGYVYPLVELALGVGYLLAWQTLAVNIATLVVTLLGSAGVLQALLNRRAIRFPCACLRPEGKKAASSRRVQRPVVAGALPHGPSVSFMSPVSSPNRTPSPDCRNQEKSMTTSPDESAWPQAESPQPAAQPPV